MAINDEMQTLLTTKKVDTDFLSLKNNVTSNANTYQPLDFISSLIYDEIEKEADIGNATQLEQFLFPTLQLAQVNPDLSTPVSK